MAHWSNPGQPMGGWTGEIQGGAPREMTDDMTERLAQGRMMPGEENLLPVPRMGGGGTAQLNMRSDLPDEVVEMPANIQEAYIGSLKAMLRQNKGNYIVATFLVGTQNTVSWEGILYEVGNDYVTIYQPGRDRYIVSDIYSLRYVEFYDLRRREMCDRMMMQRRPME